MATKQSARLVRSSDTTCGQATGEEVNEASERASFISTLSIELPTRQRQHAVPTNRVPCTTPPPTLPHFHINRNEQKRDVDEVAKRRSRPALSIHASSNSSFTSFRHPFPINSIDGVSTSTCLSSLSKTSHKSTSSTSCSSSPFAQPA